MARIARNDIEREFDREFIAGVLQLGGPDTNAVEVWRSLNARRESNARDAALKSGKSAEDAERLARAARISLQTVRADIRVLVGRARDAGVAGAAVFLDDQLGSIQDEIEATHLMDEEIAADLERSRNTSWVRSRGVQTRRMVREGGRDVEKTGVEPADVVRYRLEDGAAQAALYARLQENLKLRAKLRAEQRLVRFGRMTLPPEIEDEAEVSLAAAVSGLDDPDDAREACLRLLRRELRELTVSAGVPLAGDMLRLERERIATLEARIRNIGRVREYIKPEGAEGAPRSIEVVFERAPTRQLPAAPEGGSDG